MKEDKTLTCRECGAEFVFSASEQEFYEEKDSQMNLDVVLLAVKPANNAWAMVNVHRVKCILQLVLSAVAKQKFHSVHLWTDQFIAAIASINLKNNNMYYKPATYVAGFLCFVSFICNICYNSRRRADIRE